VRCKTISSGRMKYIYFDFGLIVINNKTLETPPAFVQIRYAHFHMLTVTNMETLRIFEAVSGKLKRSQDSYRWKLYTEM
jgi:hypothetical protein